MKNRITNIILTIVLIVIPVLIIPNKDEYYQLARYILLLACGTTLFIIFLINRKNITFDRNDKLVFLFLILVLISAIFSINITKSVFGEQNRYEGAFTFVTYILIYYMAKYHFQPNKKVIDVTLGVYSAIFILAIIQFYFPNICDWYVMFKKGAHGTFGNTNFMGSFVSIVLPAVSLGYILKGNRKYLIPTALGFCAMLMCIARSSWVAFALYMIIEIIYVALKKDKKYLKRLLIIIITFLISFTFIMIIPKGKQLIIGKSTRMAKEIVKINETGITNEMGSGRIKIWKISLNVIKKFPIKGCGVDSLLDGIIVADAQGMMDFINTYHQKIDKAHNEYLQIAATIGIPALIVYLTFVSDILIRKLKNIKKNELNILFFTIIVGYLAQAFFNISTIGIAPLFWFVLGYSQNKNVNK